MLDKMLQYPELPESRDFVSAVMQGVARQQKARRLILLLSGLVGVLFGLFGALMLADSLKSLVGQVLISGNVMVSGIIVFAVIGFFGWLFHEENFLPL